MCNSPHCLPAHTHIRSCSPQPVVPLLRALCKVQFANNTRLSQLVTLQWQAAVAVVVLVVGEFECSLRHARSHTHTHCLSLSCSRVPHSHILEPSSHPHASTLSHASHSLCTCVCVCEVGAAACQTVCQFSSLQLQQRITKSLQTKRKLGNC